MTKRSDDLLFSGETRQERSLEDLLEPVNNPQGKTKFIVREVIPIPSFVVKTNDDKDNKTFINVCGCAEIPAPGDWSGGQIPEEVTTALKKKDPNCLQEALRFPLSMGPFRPDKDKKGEPCFVYDCLFNLDVAVQAQSHRRLKIFLAGLAVEWLSQKNEVKCSSDFKLPKMKYKGNEVVKQNIKIRGDPLVREIKPREANNESAGFSFAFSKPKQTKQERKVNKVEKKEESKEWKYAVKYNGTPVESISIAIELPKHLKEGCPEIWLNGLELCVRFEGVENVLVVKLAFAVDTKNSEVIVDFQKQQMSLQLPVLSICAFLDEALRSH